MKYKFSGDNDVPEWLLAEVSTLSKISCVRLKLITRAVINELSGGVLDVEKVTKLVPPNITWSDIKAVLAAISFILRGAVRNAVDEVLLNAELQQLGLPKENSDGVSRPYRIHKERLRAQATAESLRAPRLLSLDWRVDAVISTSTLGQLRKLGADEKSQQSLGEPVISVRFGVSHAAGTLPPRYPSTDLGATPLLLEAQVSKARGGASSFSSSSSQQPAAMGTPLDAAEGAAALVALGIRPIQVGGSGGDVLVAGGGGGEGGGGGSGAGGGAGGSGGALAPKITPSVFFDFSLTADKASAFLAELRVANTILQKTVAALPPAK